MPKRVIDFDALWASDKLASCAEWAQCEYAWLYGLADASGSFEMGNLRVIWGRVAAIRKNLTLERLGEIFDEFIARGLLFTWEENGKRYGHWTGSDVPGRLPPPSWRMRFEKLAPPVPRQALAAYSAGFGGSREGVVLGANAREAAPARAVATVAAAAPAAMGGAPIARMSERDAQASALKAEVEETQARDWDLDLNLDLDLEKEVSASQHAQERGALGTPASLPATRPQQIQERGNAAPQALPSETAPEELLAIYEAERGALPPAHILTADRRGKCAQWLAAGFTADDFREAVRRAANTPFLAGAGERGWRASFDWLIADAGNARKVLHGEYAPSQQLSQPLNHQLNHQLNHRPATKWRGEKRALADLYAGTGPRPADCGVRVNPAALERIRAREARLALGVPHAQIDAPIDAQAGASARRKANRRCGLLRRSRCRTSHRPAKLPAPRRSGSRAWRSRAPLRHPLSPDDSSSKLPVTH